jgi:hypothetical protein
VQKTDATDLNACMLAEPSLHGRHRVLLDGPPRSRRLVYTSSCNAPADGPWQEEDGGRQYVKTCPNR